MEITATLLEIKSRSLLPAVEEDYSLGEETPEQEIIRRLDEFRILKEASENSEKSKTSTVFINSRICPTI